MLHRNRPAVPFRAPESASAFQSAPEALRPLACPTLFLSLLILSFFADSPAQGQLLSPVDRTNLSSTTTFTWPSTGGRHQLYLGTTGAGSSNVHYSGLLSSSVTSTVVSGIPLNQVVYVRLYSESGANTNAYYRDDYTFNLDLDTDGIFDAIDPHPSMADSVKTRAGSGYTLSILGSGRVAFLNWPTMFSATNKSMTSTQMRQITAALFTHLKDDFDFILLASNQSGLPSGAAYYGIYYGVKNDITGLGKSIFNSTSLYGSAGRLQGAIHLINKEAMRDGPSLHEICHRWANTLTSVPTVDVSHWGWSSAGGQLGGWKSGSLESLGGNLYRAQMPGTTSFGPFGSNANYGNTVPYSEMELYAMGLISSSEVQNSLVIANGFQWVDSSAGRFTATSLTTKTMAQITAADGVRTPGPATSQKSFRMLYVLLGSATPSGLEWAEADEDVYYFDLDGSDGTGFYNFWEATGGRATVKLDGLADSLLPLPTLAVRQVNRSQGGTTTVTVPSRVGYQYVLNYGTDLASWQTLPAVAGTGSDLPLSHSASGSPRMFYWVHEQLGSGSSLLSPGGITASGSELGSDSACPCIACANSEFMTPPAVFNRIAR